MAVYSSRANIDPKDFRARALELICHLSSACILSADLGYFQEVMTAQ
jgi:hypothetical protein